MQVKGYYMIQKTALLITALFFTGCSAVDDAINNAVNDIISGDVTTETIREKDKVLILNEVSLSACTVIKNGLLSENDYRDAEILVTELGVTCATYGKIEGDPEEITSECIEQSLAEWLQEEGHEEIIDFETAQGDKACVIGANL